MRGRLRREGAQLVEGQLVEAVAQGRAPRAAVDQQRGGADRDHADDDRGNPAVALGPRGRLPLEAGQVLVHPLAGLPYLPFDFTRRSTHSLFSFKVSIVRGGSLSCRRALPIRITTTPMTR